MVGRRSPSQDRLDDRGENIILKGAKGTKVSKMLDSSVVSVGFPVIRIPFSEFLEH